MLLLPITVTVIKDIDYKTRASSLVLEPETDLVKEKWEFIFCILTVYDYLSPCKFYMLFPIHTSKFYIISCIFCHLSGPESKAISWFILGFELIWVIYILYDIPCPFLSSSFFLFSSFFKSCKCQQISSV